MSKKERNFLLLGKYLTKKRQAAGLSQSEVSRQLGYKSPQFVSNTERGLSSLPIEKLRILLDVYDIPARELTEILIEEQRNYYKKTLHREKNREAKKA